MSQNNTTIANGTGLAVRTAINNALSTLETHHSGPSAPTTTYAYMTWADTTNNLMKIRNGANNAWITIGALDVDNLGLVIALSYQMGSYISGASATGNDSYVVTLYPTPASLASGLLVELWPDVGNTGACSLNANGLGVKAIKKNLNGSIVDLDTGDILAHYPALLRYAPVSGYFLLINPMQPVSPTFIQYLVGDILMTTTVYANSAAVAAAYGYGTWAAWGTGKFPVGFDSGQTEFNAVEKTGGAKTKDATHVHAVSLDLPSVINGATHLEDSLNAPVVLSNNNEPGLAPGVSGNVNTGGNASQDVLNPYIVCYYWKRTA